MSSREPSNIRLSRQPDLAVLRAGDSLDFDIPVNDVSVTLTPLGGSRMCALGVSSTALACGTEAFSLTGIFDQDVVQLSCPDSPAPQPDLSRTIPLSIRTGYSCPSLVVQIGCDGSYCQGYGYPGAQQTTALAYPVLTPVARLRVRVLSSGSMSTQWTAFFGGDVIFLDQVNSQWLEVAVPQDANQIDLRTSCMAEPLLEKIYVVVYNYCEETT